MEVDLEALDRLGFTVVRNLLPRHLTTALRRCTDALLAERGEDRGGVQSLRAGDLYADDAAPLLAAALAEPRSLRLAHDLLRVDPGSEELQLLEQVLIRTDPSPPPHGARGWHLDWAFLPEHMEAVPRQVYYHMVTMCSSVLPGGGCFSIVPGSHHKTFAAAARACTIEELHGHESAASQSAEDTPLAALKSDPAGVAGIDLADAVEVPAGEGDAVIFNPSVSPDPPSVWLLTLPTLLSPCVGGCTGCVCTARAATAPSTPATYTSSPTSPAPPPTSPTASRIISG